MLWLHYEVLCSSNPTIGVAMAKVHVIWLHPSTFAIHYTSFKSALNRNKRQHSQITTIIRAFSSPIIVSPLHNTCAYFSTNLDLILTWLYSLCIALKGKWKALIRTLPFCPFMKPWVWLWNSMVATIAATPQVKKMILRVKGDFLQEFYHSRKTFTNL